MVARILSIKDATHQGLLEAIVHKLFPGENVLKNSRKEASIKNPATGLYLELDLWLPERNICFEFQDAYHYISAWYSHIPLPVVQEQDALKSHYVQARGDTLIVVPCWWDGYEESLIASVQFQRPDLFSTRKAIDPIPLSPPSHYFELGIPDVGELMLASFPLSLKFNNSISPQDSWWMGEKYDGIRFCWHPTFQTLYTRSGYELEVPEEYADLFPAIFLDGEIWFGRGLFLECQKLIRSPMDMVNWPFLRVIGFDEPVASHGPNFPYEERYSHLIDSIPGDHQFIVLSPRVLCENRHFLAKSSKNIIGDGGEGIILRQPGSLYEHGRSTQLIKLKAARGDKEAIVTKVAKDGTVSLKMPDGITFAVPSENVRVFAKPIRGDVVTFNYESYSRRSVPVNPKIYRIRTDMSWEDVLRAHAKEAPQSQTFTDVSKRAIHSKTHPHHYWTSEKGKNMRVFFEDFAKANDFDPLLATNWYRVSRKVVLKARGSTVLSHFNWSLIKSLVSLFPEVKFDPTKFDVSPRKYWKSVANRKRFFINFAKEKGFEALVPENWYPVKKKVLGARKGASALLSLYQGNFVTALVHLFPDIGYVRSKFAAEPCNYWLDAKNRKEVFENFAKESKFNPYVASNWYNITDATLQQSKDYQDIRSVLEYYNGSVVKALVELFTEVNFDDERFVVLPKPSWHTGERGRKDYFVNFAQQRGFDPLVAENWYSVLPSDLFTFRGLRAAQQLVSYYSGSYVVALQSLFPNIGLDKDKFSFYPSVKRTHWSDPTHRTEMLLDFAKHKKFDPLVADNWYPYTLGDLVEFKGARDVKSMLIYHNGSFVKALKQLFPKIRLQENKFNVLPRNYWLDTNHRIQFFKDFAKQRGFDPLLPEGWYSVTTNALLAHKGAGTILSYYNSSFVSALLHLFPDIGLDKQKFRRIT